MPDGTNNSQYPDASQAIQGAAFLNRTLLDSITATDVGWWGPWSEPKVPRHKGSIEITASGTPSATIAILCSNAAQQPYNGYQVTVGGSISTGDKLTINLICPLFAQGHISASYTTIGGDTTSTAAAGLAAALKAALALEVTQPIVPPYAQSEASAIPLTITPEQQTAAGQLYVSVSSAVITLAWRQVDFFTVTTALSTSATETLTVSQYDDGSGASPSGLSSLTSAGITAFDVPANWIKAKCGTYSSGTWTANLTGVIP